MVNELHDILEAAATEAQDVEVAAMLPQRIQNAATSENVKEKNKKGETVLHVACRSNVSLSCINILLNIDSKLIKTTDKSKKLPLHTCMEYQTNQTVMEHILHSYPDAAAKVDDKKRTPLHLALEPTKQDENTKIDDQSLYVILAAYPKASQMQDKWGR